VTERPHELPAIGPVYAQVVLEPSGWGQAPGPDTQLPSDEPRHLIRKRISCHGTPRAPAERLRILAGPLQGT
jgi:hypothetical protein